MDKFVLIGRITDGNKLIGGVFYDLQSKAKRYIIGHKNGLDTFFKENEVLNCAYNKGRLSSTVDGIDLRKIATYNKYLVLLKCSIYTDRYIIGLSMRHSKKFQGH